MGFSGSPAYTCKSADIDTCSYAFQRIKFEQKTEEFTFQTRMQIEQLSVVCYSDLCGKSQRNI